MDFLRRFTRPPVLWTAGAIGGISAVVLLNLLLHSILFALLLVLTIVLIVVIAILFRQLRAAKASEEIEKTITRQADRDIERSVPGKAAEAENMKADLLQAIDALKGSKIGKRRGQAVLSTLPWYMVIGPAGAGKSSLVSESGLHFPLLDEKRRPKSVRGVGGTRSFEWWLSEEAVILDMAGRTLGTAEFEDSDDWIDFLQVLRKQRKQKPVSGVLVAVPIDQIAGRTEPQIDDLAHGIRERLQELIHHLGVVFPVYLVVTQADRLAGFAEFFSELSHDDRDQVWGATFPIERTLDEAADRLFESEFQVLTAALSDRRMARLADVPDPGQRARAFAFPLQVERLGPGVKRLVQTVFEPDSSEEAPLFRGFYLTSARQEGAPVDRVFQPIAAALGAAAPAQVAPPKLPEGSFFVHELFTRVAFPDAALATSSTRAESERRRGHLWFFGGVAVVWLAIVVLLSALSCANGRLVDRAKRTARESAERIHTGAAIMPTLQALEDLRVQAALLDSLRQRKPFFRRLGGYSGDVLRDPVMQLYMEKSLETLIAPSAKAIEANLARMTDTGEGAFIDYYYLYRAWRLLGEPRQIRPEDAPILTRELKRVVEPQLYSPTPADRQRFPELLGAQVRFLAAHPDLFAKWAPAYYSVGSQDLIARATARVRNTWDSSQFYRLLQEEIVSPPPPVNLASLLGGATFLNGGGEVPGVFTKEGWERHVRPVIQWYRVQLQRDWVVSEAFGGHPPEVADSLLASYARDYTGAWVRFMDGISLASPENMVGTARMVSQAAADDSPILRVVRAVGEQTTLPADGQSPLARVTEDFDIVHDFFGAEKGASQRARNALESLKRMLPGQKSDPLDTSRPPSAHYQDQLREAQKQIERVAKPDTPPSEMKGMLTYGTDATNPVKGFVNWVDMLVEAYPTSNASHSVGRLLKLPITSAEPTVQGRVVRELNPQWKMLVYDPFQKTLAGKYPFVETGSDATLEDFAEFFRPGGTYASFYDSFLKDLVLEDGSPKDPAVPPPFSGEFLGFMRRVHEIRQAFFAGGATAPTLKFAVRAMTPKVEGNALPGMVSLDVGGRAASYSMGVQQWLELEWPGAEAAAGATVRGQSRTGAQPEAISAPGPWGLFHLLDRAQYAQIDSPTPQVSWSLPAGGGRIIIGYEIQPGSTFHPFRPGSLRITPPAGL